MKTNEAIKFLEMIIEPGRIIFVDETMRIKIDEYIGKFDEAIKQFEICAKHKEMWETFKSVYGSRYVHCYHPEYHNKISFLMEEFEQKYHPKVSSIDELSEIVDKMEEMIDKGLITAEELTERLIPKG